MARTLRQPLPSSSVARLLDPGAVERALAPLRNNDFTRGDSRTDDEGDDTHVRARVRQRPIKREVLLTREADAALDALIQTFREASGARLTASPLIRALLMVAHHAAAAIRREALVLGPQTLPSNAPAYEQEREQLEQRLTAALIRGIAAYRPDIR
ncbi:MAG: hypothetical protein AMXMBFR47_36280 [Planctomycetota bacterium]